MKTLVALLAVGWTLLALAGCSGKEDESREVIWRLDKAATIAKADPETRAWAKKKVEGLDIVLRLHGKNFDLGITGADSTEKSSGTWSEGYGTKKLRRKMLNGAPAPEGSELVVKSDLKHIYIVVSELEAVLSAK